MMCKQNYTFINLAQVTCYENSGFVNTLLVICYQNWVLAYMSIEKCLHDLFLLPVLGPGNEKKHNTGSTGLIGLQFGVCPYLPGESHG